MANDAESAGVSLPKRCIPLVIVGPKAVGKGEIIAALQEAHTNFTIRRGYIFMQEIHNRLLNAVLFLADI